ncbi:universal stress protein [Mycolicibacterium neoaurum]|nr:universal stress protein [Mycolicibacterium neoaurum]
MQDGQSHFELGLAPRARPVAVAVLAGSDNREAVRSGLREAIRRRCGLVVVHAASAFETWPALGLMNEPLPEQVHRDAIELGRRALDDAVLAVELESPSVVEFWTRLYDGPVVPTLRSISRDAQLLVLAERAGRSHLWPRSVAHDLGRHSDCPVAVVPTAPRPWQDPRAPIVVGIDRIYDPTSALTSAFDVAQRKAVGVVALHRGDAERALLREFQQRFPTVPTVWSCLRSHRRYQAAAIEECSRAQLFVVPAGCMRGMAGRVVMNVVHQARVPMVSVT